MPRRSKRAFLAPDLAPVPEAVLNAFAREGMLTAADVDAATRRFKKALIERALGAELSHHLGYPPGADKPAHTPNHRNGSSEKDGPDRGRPAADCDSSRSRGHVRAAVDCAARPAVQRLR